MNDDGGDDDDEDIECDVMMNMSMRKANKNKIK